MRYDAKDGIFADPDLEDFHRGGLPQLPLRRTAVSRRPSALIRALLKLRGSDTRASLGWRTSSQHRQKCPEQFYAILGSFFVYFKANYFYVLHFDNNMLSIFILELHRSNLVITAFTILKLTLLFRYKTEAPSHCYCRSILLVGNGEKICEIASQPTNVNQLQWSEALGCCVQRLRPHQSFLRKTWQLFAGLSVKFIRFLFI